MTEKIIITIGRQYGSGGKLIGQKLSEALSIPCYDKELLTVAAQKSGICQEMFENHDGKPTNSLLYSLVMGTYTGNNLPINHKLFLAQFDAIRAIADKGSCIIIGRCADYALEDYENCINIFIHADMKDRVKRAVEQYGLESDKPEEAIQKIDKKRASYYNFYSSKKWGQTESYHLTINSSLLGIDDTVKVILDFIRLKEKELNNRN